MAMKEYSYEDPSYGPRTVQHDADERPVPEGYKLVGDVEASGAAEPDGRTLLDEQEPGNVLDESARGQATQADVEKAKRPANKARAAADK